MTTNTKTMPNASTIIMISVIVIIKYIKKGNTISMISAHAMIAHMQVILKK